MNVDLEQLKAKVESEVKELEERKTALQQQLAHVEAVQKFAEEVDDPSKEAAASASEEPVSSFPEGDQKKEIFGQTFG
jgi:hypothetical protein